MKYQNPHKQILSQTRQHWDRDQTRTAVRGALTKVLQCRTAELGGRVYASAEGERTFYDPCKSRSCSSCGYRATVQWLRERWVALPDVPYKGITFTMPDLLWPLFHDNRLLANALSALAAAVIKARLNARFGIRAGVIAILHTFNGKLEFNSHVHTMVTGGGLNGFGIWMSSDYADGNAMMQAWRKAVIALLRAALRAGQIRTKMSVDQMEEMLEQQEKRWWSVKIQSFEDKGNILQYAGRYVKRPPIAQRRITWIGERTVRFWYNDKKLHRRVEVECSLEEFVDRWAQHIPEFYEHAVRNFGLFGPRALGQTSAAIFTILRQERRPRPRPRRWADSRKRDFGYDPLLDSTGKRMKFSRRLAPQAAR